MITTCGAAQVRGYSVGATAGAAPGLCTLSGTITTCDQDSVVAGAETIILTLSGGLTWESTVGADNAITTALIAGIDSAQSEASGWDAVVKVGLAYTDVTRTSSTVVTITLPAFSGYAITATEIITVTVPATAVDGSGGALIATPTITVVNVAQAVTLTGTAMASITADNVADGGETLIFTLTGDQFVATLGADNAITTAFIAGIDSAQSEATGWDAVVKAAITHANVVRDSATQVTVTLPAAATYAISTAETITCTVPATSLLASSTAVVASPVFTVSAPSCALTGTITTADQDDIIAGGQTIILTLSDVTWESTVGADNAATTALISGLDSAQSETYGWDAIVKAGLDYTAVTRTSNTVVTITLPAFSGYAITANETITATVPASAIASYDAGIITSPTATIDNVTEAVAVAGTGSSGMSIEDVVNGGKEFIFTVTGDQFVSTLGADNAITTAFLAGIDSDGSEATGWDAVVKASLDYTMLTRDSATQCTLVLPAAASFDIDSSETVTCTIPATSLLASSSSVVATPTVTVSAGASLVFSYGFEDWGGSIASTPNYCFKQGTQAIADFHEGASEVVASYDGLSPYSGSYFFLLNHSDYAMSPAVSGITSGYINAGTSVGAGYAGYGGGNSFNLQDSSCVTTGEIFVRWYMATSSYVGAIPNNGTKLKTLRIPTGVFNPTWTQQGYDEVIWLQGFQYKATSPLDPVDETIYLYRTGEVSWANAYGDVDDWDDKDWHRCSVYVNLNTGVYAAWYDVENETLDNAVHSDVGDGNFGDAFRSIKLIDNWGGVNPVANVWHAIDSIEIWDGIP